jgi:hypothetical protein
MAQEVVHKIEGTVQTTDATVTTVSTFTAMPDASVAMLYGRLVGRRPSSGESAGYELIATYKRHAGGAPTLVNSTVNASHEDDVTWGGMSFAVSGNDIQLRTTGIAAATIEWMCLLEIVIYQP